MGKEESVPARQSGIELLRILAILGVIVLHYNNPAIGGGFSYVSSKANYYFMLIMENICVCAVDLFILISGYFLCASQKRKVIKPLQLIVQVMIFGLLIYCFKVVSGRELFSLKNLLFSIVPSNYFAILYAGLYFISPYLNILLDGLSEKQWKKFLIMMIVIFSIWPTFVDLFTEISGQKWKGLSTIGLEGSQQGYTIINFILLYIVGAYLRKSDLKEKYKQTKNLCVMAALCVAILTVWSVFFKDSAWEYCNPIIILEAAIFFLLFSKMQFYHRGINLLSKGAFTCFLLQTYYFAYFNQVKEAVQKPLWFLVVHMIGTAILIYGICWIVYLIYNFVEKPVFKKIDSFLESKISIY